MKYTITSPLTKPALVVMDFQKVILENFIPREVATAVIPATANLLGAARTAKIPVFYVMVGFDDGYPEVSSNKLFSSIKSAGFFELRDCETNVHEALQPSSNEKVFVKHRIGAFTGTSLDMVLRAHGVETLILAGVTTGGVVLSTARQALDLDYALVIASDCCADVTVEKHSALIQDVLAEHAVIANADELISLLVPIP